jgi:hypothetical protein
MFEIHLQGAFKRLSGFCQSIIIIIVFVESGECDPQVLQFSMGFLGVDSLDGCLVNANNLRLTL